MMFDEFLALNVYEMILTIEVLVAVLISCPFIVLGFYSDSICNNGYLYKASISVFRFIGKWVAMTFLAILFLISLMMIVTIGVWLFDLPKTTLENFYQISLIALGLQAISLAPWTGVSIGGMLLAMYSRIKP